MSKGKLVRALVACLLGLTLLGPPALAGEADDIFQAAGKAFQEGNKCLKAGRQPGANQFLENEKAIGHLEQSQRLLEQYLEMRPDDSGAESMMQEVLSLLFWCHKMSPMVDPEEIEEEDPEEIEEPVEESGPTAEEEAAAKAEAEAAAKAAAEEEAAKLLDEARAFQADHDGDGMGALAKFFYVAERFPETAAGQAAQKEAEALQDKLFAVKPVVPKKKKLEPLTADDKSTITKELKGWLKNRQKVRCASCKGQGYSECKKCKGSGKLFGRAGRKQTCPKCKRGKIKCKRKACVEGIDTRFLEKVVIKARAPYYQEKLKALLGGQKDALDAFLDALAATLSGSPRAASVISNRASELGIDPVQLRDVIEAHGPGPDIIAPFTSFNLGKIKRKTRYTLKGDTEQQQTVTFEQQDGKWYVRGMK